MGIWLALARPTFMDTGDLGCLGSLHLRPLGLGLQKGGLALKTAEETRAACLTDPTTVRSGPGTEVPTRKQSQWGGAAGAQPLVENLLSVRSPGLEIGKDICPDYRLCLERELRRGRAGVCGDPSLRAVLWQILVEDFDLHGALQDDALALLTDGLWGRADLAPALRGLARAFELLELAAVHLYLLPWRKEFATIKTFSGGYVHVLKGALSEDLLLKSFHKMGYVRSDHHRLTVTAPPPACQLVQAALGCFALRLECEFLGEVLARLGTSMLPAQELLQARRASGDVASCVAWLQQRLARDEEPPPLPPRGSPSAHRAPLDLYRDPQEDEGSEEASVYGGPTPGPDSPPVELAYRPPLWEQSAKLWGAGGQAWEPPAEELPQASSPPYGALEELGPEPSAFSFLSLRGELSHPGDLVAPEAPGSPGGASPRHLRVEAVPESPGYQAHSCLAPGTLPVLCCDTCRQLHAAHCAALPTCRLGHSLRALLGDTQRRLWLQRTQVDTLLYGSPGARS
ncbi:spermatogenesis-associated protein 2-like protein [Tupaia chinensis]|uniref:spermatogenesis-associated protein 2-like protein n=1 Tax=Tupaia chinensis TaxID=246437 RepID=UPI0007047109|nr:spermatogenesis-associated protein 2-like protein [Tupaia chinensis]